MIWVVKSDAKNNIIKVSPLIAIKKWERGYNRFPKPVFCNISVERTKNAWTKFSSRMVFFFYIRHCALVTEHWRWFFLLNAQKRRMTGLFYTDQNKSHPKMHPNVRMTELFFMDQNKSPKQYSQGWQICWKSPFSAILESRGGEFKVP